MKRTDRSTASTASAAGGAAPRALLMRIGFLLNRTALQTRQQAQAALEPLGLIPPQVAVLSALESEGPQTQRALGALLKIDPTTMVWLIDGLERKNLVQRDAHPKDRRAYLVRSTPAGRALYQRAWRRLDQLQEQFLAPLSGTEREELRRLLLKLFRHVPTQGIPSKFFARNPS